MKALVLEKKQVLAIRDMPMQGKMSKDTVRIKVKNVGVCGSDVHYYTHGKIGHYVVKEPMILGHEAAGEVIEVGDNVKNLKIGDRVCMEPGIPNPKSKAAKLGIYNLDPEVFFWATPPDHGCLIEEVIHPAEYTYKLPDNVSYAEGAMVEPLAIGLQTAKKAFIVPGDVAVVVGAGTIGIMAALSLLAGGCSKVYISDIKQEKLDIAASYKGIRAVNVQKENLLEIIKKDTDNWGADILVEASGAEKIYPELPDYLCPNGKMVLVGIPIENVSMDISKIQSKEITITSVFRYANIFDRAVNLIASGKIDVKKLISKIYPFEQAIEAFQHAEKLDPKVVKIQISL